MGILKEISNKFGIDREEEINEIKHYTERLELIKKEIDKRCHDEQFQDAIASTFKVQDCSEVICRYHTLGSLVREMRKLQIEWEKDESMSAEKLWNLAKAKGDLELKVDEWLKTML